MSQLNNFLQQIVIKFDSPNGGELVPLVSQDGSGKSGCLSSDGEIMNTILNMKPARFGVLELIWGRGLC